jgi:hypothetical protein
MPHRIMVNSRSPPLAMARSMPVRYSAGLPPALRNGPLISSALIHVGLNRVGKLEAAFSGSAKGRSAVYFASLFNGVRVGCIQFRHQRDTVLRAIRLFRSVVLLPVFPIPVLSHSTPSLTGAASPASVYGGLREKRRPALTPFIGVSRGPKQHGLLAFMRRPNSAVLRPSFQASVGWGIGANKRKFGTSGKNCLTTAAAIKPQQRL